MSKEPTRLAATLQDALPSGWVVTTIGEVADVVRGASPRPKGDPEYFGGSIPWIKISDVTKSRGKYVVETIDTVTDAGALKSRYLPAGTLILSNSGTVCVPKIMGVDGCIHDGFVAFPALTDHVSREYLYYYFDFIRPRIIQENRQGVTQVNLNTTIVREIQLPLPPRLEQTGIVAEIEKQFSRLDAAVAALERLQANLKRYKAAVLKAACEGRLVPQNPDEKPAGKLLERILAERRRKWEEQEWERLVERAKKKAAQAKRKKAGRPGRISDLAPEEWEALPEAAYKGYLPKNQKWKEKYQEPERPDTSELPELPAGWVWATWEQVSPRVTVGHVGSMKDEYVDSGIPFLRGQNVRENRFDPEGLKYITPEFDAMLAKSGLKPGDMVVTRSGNVGVTCVIPNSLGRANCADLVIIQKPAGVNPEFGAYYMNSLARSHVRAGQVGVALIHFNTKSVAKLPIGVPPEQEQFRIVAEVERRLSVLEVLEDVVKTDSRRAERMRQAVLRKAFSGQLVAQDPEDEPASALLARIRAQREKKKSAGKEPHEDTKTAKQMNLL